MRVRHLFLVLLIAAAFALPLWHVHVVDGRTALRANDLTGRLVGARAAINGQDPYSAPVLRQIQIAYYGRPLRPSDNADPQRFAYPAYLIPLLAPLASMYWSTACLLFLLIVSPLLVWSIWACIRLVNPALSSATTAMTVFLVFCSWPVIWALRLVQPTLLVAVAVFLGCFFLSRGYHIAAGALLAISVLKPPLVLPLLVWLLLWAILHRAWKLLASFLVTFTLLSLATEKIAPGWFSHWRADLRGYGPNTMLPLQFTFGHWPGLIATLLLLAWSAWLLWRLRHAPARSLQFALAVSIALSAAVCANLMKGSVIYDHVMIIPCCLLLAFSQPTTYYAALTRRVSMALIVFGYVLVPLAILGESIFPPSDFWDTLPCRNLILPAVVTIALAFQALETFRVQRTDDLLPLPLATNPSL